MAISKTVRLAASVLAKHANGAGGRALAASRTPEQRQQAARAAAQARWDRLKQCAEHQNKVIL